MAKAKAEGRRIERRKRVRGQDGVHGYERFPLVPQVRIEPIEALRLVPPIELDEEIPF